MNNSNITGSPVALIKIAIPTITLLAACYMPFLERKGLFIPSAQQRRLGDRVFLILRLSAENQFAAGAASVCWITPMRCSDGCIAGFGLHFDDGQGELAGMIQASLDKNNNPHRVRSYTL